MNTRKTADCSAKSNSATPTDDRGRISLGNAIFFTRFALSITDRDPACNALETKFHASNPDSRNTGKSGTSLLNTAATNEKTARNTIGFRSDQTAPSTDAVYFTFSSLRIRFSNTSRCAASSRSRGPTRRWGDSDVRSTVAVEAMAGSCSRRTPWSGRRSRV